MSARKRPAPGSQGNGRMITFDTGTGEKINGRVSNSWVVFRFYREILDIEASNRTASIDSLIYAVKRKYNMNEKKLKEDLNLAFKDRLIRCDSNVCKIDRQRRCSRSDFYCFQCFKSGDGLRKCNNCWRVYHLKCFNYSDVRGKCFFCKNYPQEPVRQKILTKKDINDALLVLYNKLKKEHSSVIDASNYVGEPKSLIELIANFVYVYDISFNAMEKKIRTRSYESVLEFVFDCKQIMFNLNVLHGPHSEFSKKAIEMEKLILSEEHFIHNCVDCYLNLGSKGQVAGGDWFLIPCNPPHEVCFTQVEGYPPYPSKIINRDEKKTFVWFFDGKRETALSSNRFTTPRLPANVKITPELKDSIDEYLLYVESCDRHTAESMLTKKSNGTS